jgi:Protein of unknown function (DUF2281)
MKRLTKISIADRIYDTVKELSETSAGEVLDLAERLKAKQAEDEKGKAIESEAPEDGFFSCAGIWQGRDLTQDSLRALAWRDNKA